MKSIVPICILAMFVCAGCATRYDMKLTNGMIITSKGKPRLDAQNHVIYFIDGRGQSNALPEFRVVEIAPHSTMAKEDETKKFQSVTKQ